MELQDEFRAWVNEWVSAGAVVNSFIRGPRFPGDQSQHQRGLAVDFAYNALTERISEDARLREFVVIEEPTHLHVQRFPAGLLRRCGLL